MKFSFDPFPVLQTRRLYLRDFCKKDYAQVLFLRSDLDLNKYIKRVSPKKIEDAITFVNKVQASKRNGENINWVICFKEDLKMLGSICLWNFSSDLKTGEVGYDLHPEYHHKGIMDEALKSIIQYGFETLGLNTIKAYTHHSNLNSIKLLKKNNFLPTSEKDLANEDNKVFNLTHPDFQNNFTSHH